MTKTEMIEAEAGLEMLMCALGALGRAVDFFDAANLSITAEKTDTLLSEIVTLTTKTRQGLDDQ